MDRACERPAPLRAWPSGLLCVLLLLELGACGSHVPTTCGMGGGQPRPDIGGEILYMCYASGSIHGGLFLLNASSGPGLEYRLPFEGLFRKSGGEGEI